MRPLSTREFRLAVAAGAVVAAGLTWFVVRGRLERLAQLRAERVAVELDLIRQEGLLGNFQRIRAQLPRHPEGRDIKSELSRQVETVAMRSGLRITSLTPEAEEYLPELDLYLTSIRCGWEGGPERMVDFLHRMQQLGAVADIRELRLRDRSSAGAELGGSFTIEFAYTRIPAGGNGGAAAPPAEETVQEPGETL